MRQITVIYHQEDGVWWAETSDLPGFSSAADSVGELRKLTHEGISIALDGAPHMILEVSASQPAVPTQQAAGASSVQASTPSFPEFFNRLSRPTRSDQATNPNLVLV